MALEISVEIQMVEKDIARAKVAMRNSMLNAKALSKHTAELRSLYTRLTTLEAFRPEE